MIYSALLCETVWLIIELTVEEVVEVLREGVADGGKVFVDLRHCQVFFLSSVLR